jgi:hypothetical protein
MTYEIVTESHWSDLNRRPLGVQSGAAGPLPPCSPSRIAPKASLGKPSFAQIAAPNRNQTATARRVRQAGKAAEVAS